MVAITNILAIASAFAMGTTAIEAVLYSDGACGNKVGTKSFDANSCSGPLPAFGSYKFTVGLPGGEKQRARAFKGNACGGDQLYCSGSHQTGVCFEFNGKAESLLASTEPCSS